MPQPSLQADAIGLPVTREQVEAQIDILIDLLDTLDTDSDLEPDLAGFDRGMDDREGDDPDYEPAEDDEPSLGWTGASCYPEKESQDCPGFYLNADSGRDLEDEHCGREPDGDSEASLGWTSHINQTSASWQANHLGTVDLEQGVGAVRKPRPASKTGNRVLVGVEVFR